MLFGETPVATAEGAILVHTLRAGDRTLKKGSFLDADAVRALADAGFASVVTARLEPGDLSENEAAAAVGAALVSETVRSSRVSTGRCNLSAVVHGVVQIDRAAIDRANRVCEDVTLSTVQPFTVVEADDLVATVKIIPFGVAGAAVNAVAEALVGEHPAISVAPFRGIPVGLLQTRLPGTMDRVLEKTVVTTEGRVTALGSPLAREIRCDHDREAIARGLQKLRDAGCGLIIVIGASAIVDRRDVVPTAIESLGGTIRHLGMPVDPGNLTLLADWEGLPVLGFPGSARSPRLHGCDWVLQRLLAGIQVTGEDIMGMGVGGLLKEMPGRPMPRMKAVQADAADEG